MLAPFKCLLVSALAVSVVNGHGYLTIPKVRFTAQAGDPTQYIASIQASDSGFSGTFNGAPKDNVAAFTKAFKASKYTSLKEFFTDKAKIGVPGATLTCGSCDPKEDPQPMPKSTIEWSHSASEGFTPSHEGPCEVWCGNVRTFQDDNCPAHYTMVPAVLPFDREACMGATTLTFYWMAMHSESWQVYVNCAPLEKTSSTGAKSKYAVGSSTSTAQSNSTSSATSDTPSTPATEAPSAPSTPSETTAPAPPSPTDAPSTPSTDAPSTPSTDAPSTPSTDAPSTPSTDAPSTPSTPTAPTTDKSDCGSYDVAGSDSDCGSYDVAGGDDSECGSYDVAGGAESDCGSFDVAGSGGGDATKGAGSQTSFDFSAMQQGEVNTGTVSPYK
ncbi:hypothetical protein GN958_ATG04609 [Phytophthora infestans]|uniref:Uncharacterized protein n=1 Tax=Phytophthora infestans TaxID=4787 RepID=A0A8S9V3Q4_PHYIN|nr:hypothetical protein GN958_ATG04609 [Phytophthora infestans]